MIGLYSSFKNPEFLFLAIILLFLSRLFFFYRNKQNPPQGLVDTYNILEYLKKNKLSLALSVFKQINTILFVIGLLCLAIALARPQSKNELTEQNSEGIHIMMVLDISDSMLIEDMKPVNRLESAKLRIKEFIDKRLNDYIGLVVFSGQSYTRVPLTLDYKLLLESVAMVETSERLRKGTAIGMALANAVTRLENAKGESKVIILLTDGENNVGAIDPTTALEIAKLKGIRIYTVGIGKDGLAQLPIYRKFPNGMVQKFYRPMHSKVNEPLLKNMAKQTGGAYFRANQSGQLARVFSEIDKMEKVEVQVKKITQVKEHFQQWAFYGLILVLISMLFNLTLFWRNI
jgi:Ca-activated chloride channel homolog